MHRGTIINSQGDLQTMNSSYLYQSTGFCTQPFHSTRQKKATTYYETNHSPTPCRSPSPPRISLNNHKNERAKSADHSRALLNETMPVAPSSSTHTNTFHSPTTNSHLSRTTTGRGSGGFHTRSSIIYIDELHKTEEEGEKHELNTLNSRFENYLNKIKNLVNINTNLRQQVNNAYRKYIGHTEEQQIDINNNKNFFEKYQNPCEIQLNNLRKQINDEVRAQISIQIRLQRADYDIKFYQNNIKLLTTHDQKQSEHVRSLKQQLEVNLHELEQLKQQYERREQDLQMYKTHYNEYMNKLIECSNEYDTITYERMENENNLHTLKEQLSFEQEYYHRRQQELEYLEKFHYEFHKEFNQIEFHNIIKQIRQDYQEFNTIHITELETLYKTKLDKIRNDFIKQDEQQPIPKTSEVHVDLNTIKKEHQTLIEQNQLLKNKLEQLEHDLHNIIEQNRQRYEVSDREYKQLQSELPELDCIIVHLRENAVSLWSEINTYRYLLVNLLSSTNDKSISSLSTPNEKYTTSTTTDNNIQETKNLKSISKSMVNKVTTTTVGTKTKPSPQQYRDETTGFIVHIEDGIIWVRI